MLKKNYLYCFFCTTIFLALLCCDPDPTPNTPSIKFLSPANGETVNGDVTISIKASGGTGINSIELFIDDEVVKSDNNLSFNFSWDTTSVNDGQHSIKAVFTDNDNKSATASIFLTVQNSSTGSDFKTLFTVSFDQYSNGTKYSETLADGDFKDVQWLNNPERMIINDEALKVTYPADQIGPGNTGAQFKVRLPARNEYYLEYQLFFHNGFDTAAKGGKLPGLAGGKANTGGSEPTGDGWSARYMWREGGAAKLYVYHMDQPDTYGEYFDLKCKFNIGTWYTLKQRVKVNTGNNHNGEIEVWVDGQQKFLKKDFQFSTNDQAPVDVFYFSTFMGGSTSDWALSNTGYISFDSFNFFYKE